MLLALPRRRVMAKKIRIGRTVLSAHDELSQRTVISSSSLTAHYVANRVTFIDTVVFQQYLLQVEPSTHTLIRRYTPAAHSHVDVHAFPFTLVSFIAEMSSFLN